MGAMSEDDLSTYPGLNDPIVPVEAGADVLRDNPVTGAVTLKAIWRAGATIDVPIPLRLWNARCLILNGLADPDRMNKVLNYQDGTQQDERRVVRFDDNFAPDPHGRAWVQLYGSDYGGTTLGPFRVVFTLTVVEPLQGANDPKTLRVMWWKYWGNSLVNRAFKEQVWGIAPNHLAVVDTAYAGKSKAVRLIENGRDALKLVWNSARFTDLVEAPAHLDFKTVARRPGSPAENQVVMDAIVCKLGSSNDTSFPFDGKLDRFEAAADSEIGKDLLNIRFEPKTWQCMLNYGGVVKF
jgi:hypothetical protein